MNQARTILLWSLLAVAVAAPREVAAATPAAVGIDAPLGATVRFADPDADVEAGREALGSQHRFPWYDGDNDGVRRLDIETAKQFSSPNWNFSFLNLSLWELLAWTAVMVLLGWIAYWLVRAYLNREKRAALAAAGGTLPDTAAGESARVEALPFQIRRGTSDLLGEARRNYEAGNYGEAIIYLFSYQLVEMDRGQVIHLTKGKTNRQYIREIGGRRTLRELVQQTMIVFEDVFFGDYVIRRDRFESCWSRLGEFERLVVQSAV